MTDTDDLFEDAVAESAENVVVGVGPQLRAAREAKGLTLEQLAAGTRISRRHLENIEAGAFENLPGRTYAIGFARTIAKTVGLDQDDVIAMVRAEMEAQEEEAAVVAAGGRGKFEPGDPNRSPGKKLLWFSLFAIAILLVGIFFAARALFTPAAELPSLVEQQEQEEAAAATLAQQQAQEGVTAATVDLAGVVVFTAQGETWARFYDGEGNVLQEGTMREGDSFTLPADAVDPQIITGRPDLLTITIGGRAVSKISAEPETVQDVPISAEALLARPGAAQTVGFSNGAIAPAPVETTAATNPAPAARVEPEPVVSPTPTPQPIAEPSTQPTAVQTPVAAPEPAVTTTPPAAEESEQAAPVDSDVEPVSEPIPPPADSDSGAGEEPADT